MNNKYYIKCIIVVIISDIIVIEWNGKDICITILSIYERRCNKNYDFG